ncbi:epoxyqueuosine reductase [candidate division KSB1 bacterium]|nr:epoxyqueuosine reductase [candidate division KSB1 bacterium]
MAAYNIHSPKTDALKALIKTNGVALAGIADVQNLHGMPLGLVPEAYGFLSQYRYAVVMAMPFGGLGSTASGNDVSLFMEKAAIDVCSFVEENQYRALTIHTEDEFDPVHRMGLMSLKVLAKAAGLGWQGRSLLIVSPTHGPLHRLIAVLTDMPLVPDAPLPNHCGTCAKCVEACPTNALSLVLFEDHPTRREDVLNLARCRGDFGCTLCIESCPWAKLHSA